MNERNKMSKKIAEIIDIRDNGNEVEEEITKRKGKEEYEKYE